MAMMAAPGTTKSPVFRVTGLLASQPDDELKTALATAINDNLSAEEQATLDVRAAIVPSCYDHDGERVALVEFRGGVPAFLAALTADPLAGWQGEMGDADINFDRHFFGFTQLYTPKADTPVTADVIAITGLDGHAYGSWRGKGDLGRMWLRDFLSKDLPCCRTMIYGYNSKLSSRGVNTIMDYGRELLEEVRKVRNTEELWQRPLFFIAHSFGGIILVHSLVKAAQSNEDDHPAIAALYKATYGMLLFATPHKGLVVSDIQKMLIGQSEHPRNALLNQINQESELLYHQLDTFKNLIRDRKIASFYERGQTRQLEYNSESQCWQRTGDYVTAVSTDSALLQLPDSVEEKIPLNADHSMIVKFNARTDAGYTSARDKLRQYEKSAQSVVAGRFFVSEYQTRCILQKYTAANRVHYIPFSKNRYFVGRRNKLAELEQRMMVDQDCQKMSIVGLGGTGKTQVALQFAYTVKETRPEFSIFWLPAVSMESFEQACAEVVKALGIPQTTGKEEDAKELVKRHLSAAGTRQRWLLVLDNADDRDIVLGTAQSKGIVDYLPESEHGLTVYTTRTQEMAVSLTRADMLELGPMDRQDAEEFLKKSLVKKSLLNDGVAMAELLDELTCLPLAIRQATAYLNMNKTSTIAKYLRLLRNTEQDLVSLMSEEFRDDTRYKDSGNAVATTWVVSFSQICERDAVAADLLLFMSCIEWKAIPRSLLPSVQSEGRMEKAIGTLCGYSFLASREGDGRNEEKEAEEEEEEEEKEEGEEWYDMHRLVHLATRIWTSKHESVAEATEKALQHVTEVFPSDDYANRAVWRGYLPHALRILASMQSCHDETKSKLSLQVGRCLRVDGRMREAVVWLEESHRWRGTLGEDAPARLLAEHVLAMAYRADGQVKKAVALLEGVVAVRKKVLGEEHPSRLASQHELAGAYRADGQVKKAVALLEHVVAVHKKVLAEEHPDRLASQHELAGAYRADGQVKKAVALLEQVVAVRKKVLTEEHPDRLASQHALAMAYQADGQVKKAVTLLEHIVDVEEKVLAEEHPSRLASQHALAMAYRADGQVKKAVALLEGVVAVKTRVLRDDHPSRLVSIEALQDMYAELTVESDSA